MHGCYASLATHLGQQQCLQMAMQGQVALKVTLQAILQSRDHRRVHLQGCSLPIQLF